MKTKICITGIVSEDKYLSKPYSYERSLSLVQFSLVYSSSISVKHQTYNRSVQSFAVVT